MKKIDEILAGEKKFDKVLGGEKNFKAFSRKILADFDQSLGGRGVCVRRILTNFFGGKTFFGPRFK